MSCLMTAVNSWISIVGSSKTEVLFATITKDRKTNNVNNQLKKQTNKSHYVYNISSNSHDIDHLNIINSIEIRLQLLVN